MKGQHLSPFNIQIFIFIFHSPELDLYLENLKYLLNFWISLILTIFFVHNQVFSVLKENF